MHEPRYSKSFFNFLCAVCIFASTTSCDSKMNTPQPALPRDQDLPLFDPHMPQFDCSPEVSRVPPIDAQAHAWFLEARALEDRSISPRERDYVKIVRLTREAAERRHWMAMLNLASMYLENRDPTRGSADSLELVEDAVRLGIPAAFDRMGTYFAESVGLSGDATRAYAFWNRAAADGNPDALGYLGEKLHAVNDASDGAYWANIPIARKMLECAVGQGKASAAHDLYYLYLYPRTINGARSGPPTPETKAVSLRLLHHATKLGCADCATRLGIEFSEPFKPEEMIVPHLDKARAERYTMIGRAIQYNPSRRLPNLDRILPLPPVELPPWDGTRESLLQAAMGVVPEPSPPEPSVASALKGRGFLDAAYRLRPTGETSHETDAPFAGYWQPTAPEHSPAIQAQLAAIPPGLYKRGERFDTIYPETAQGARSPIAGIRWQYWITVLHTRDPVYPQAVPAIARVVARPRPLQQSSFDALCETTGVWQPWLPDSHSFRWIVNQPWRQAWVRKGQPFPQPKADWLLDLPAKDLTWHLMEKPSEERGPNQ